MVGTGGRKKIASSSKTVEAAEAAKNTSAEGQTSQSPPAGDVDGPKEGGAFEDKVDIPVEMAEKDGKEEMPDGRESEKATKVDNDGDNKVESEHNTSEDDEIDDDQEVLMWEDDENVADEDEVSAEEASEEEEDDGEDEDNRENATEMEAKAKEGREVKKQDSDKVEAGLKNDKTPNKRTRKKNVLVVGSKKLESGDKPESSLKKKGKKKRVESMGMIFMCSSKTKDDCFHYKVLGLPESKKDVVEKIYSGMRLFLYDLDLKLLYGIFKASGPGGYNIEPKAFKSQFPSQVRFTVLDNCLPIAEEKFKKVIKENYFTKTKFDCQLKSEQVKELCKLFITSSKGHLNKKPRRPRKSEKPQPLRQAIIKRRRLDQEPRYLERPRKHPRPQPLPTPLPSTIPLYPYERTSDRRDQQYNALIDTYRRDPSPVTRLDPYRDRRDPSPVTRRDPYRDRRDPSPVTRRDPYREGRDPLPVTRRDPYREGRDPLPVTRRDPYREGHDPFPERDRLPYRDGQVQYVQLRDSYRDGRNAYPRRRDDQYDDGRASYFERRDPYVDGQGSYLERRDPYDEPYGIGTYRRDPLLDRRDAYREDGGGEYRDSFRREGVLERGGVGAFDFETRYRADNVGSRDVMNRQRLSMSYADPIYPGVYPSSRGGVGLTRDYRL